MFSGGKDSTLLTILVLEYLGDTSNGRPATTVVYSDSMLEFPQAKAVALGSLWFVEALARDEGLPVETRYVRPKVQDSFWVNLIGRGYTPPRAHFRWCTQRLKVNPSWDLVADGSGGQKAVLTGVRFDKSPARKTNLKLSCARAGECGQDFWMRYGPNGSNITYFAPVAFRRTCKVWDFLTFHAPSSGWPTGPLASLYGRQSLRFGCWTCTLVNRDRAAEALIVRGEDEVIERLTAFRTFLDEASRNEELRWRDELGNLRGFSLVFCRLVLDRLLEIQSEVEMPLVSDEEVRAIREIWKARKK